MGTVTRGVLIFFAIVFIIGGIISFLSGTLGGATICGILVLILFYAAAHDAKKEAEKIHKQLDQYRY